MYLLDTCTFIWTVKKDNKIPPEVLSILRGYDDVFVSQATFWEIAIKKTTGKLDVVQDSFELEELCVKQEIEILPLKMEYFERIQNLPLIHRDPFDRIIVATAIEEDLTLLTNDENIKKYDEVKTLWQTTKEEQ